MGPLGTAAVDVSTGDPRCLIGCAGWSIRREHAALFPGDGTHLARYAGRLGAVEINSSFYRPHRRATYERWAMSVPERFRFAVKAPREITHDLRMVGASGLLDAFLEQAGGLGGKLGPILLQLPPSMDCDRRSAERFLSMLRDRFGGFVVLEPRHPEWFGGDADRMLVAYRVARVAADPGVVPAAATPGGWRGLSYSRLHGSPRMYESAYGSERLEALAAGIGRNDPPVPAWCVFDNTKYGAAAIDALELCRLQAERTRTGRSAVRVSSTAPRSTR